MSQPVRSFLMSAGVAQAVQRVLAVAFGNKLSWIESHCRHISLCSQLSWTRASSSLREKNYIGSSTTMGIFLYVVNSVECVLAVAIGNKLRWFESHCRHISLCTQLGWRVLAVAFGNKLCWFESHCRHIYLCSQLSWTRASSSLRKQTTLVQVPLSAYFFM